MKKSLYTAFLIIFLSLGLLLSLPIAIVGPSEAGANERLSSAPVFMKDGKLNDRFLLDTANWINDHFFLRQELISFNNLLNASVFQVSEKDSVILGTDGWLYYGSTLDDYTGQSPMTQKELSSAARNLELMAQFCAENGKQFVFMICPNKNSLYDANMPNMGAKSEVHDAQHLMDLLENVSYIDLFSAFSAQNQILYFKTDSHWDNCGAALGADLINQAFGISTNYFSGPFTSSAEYTGDLYEMLYPAVLGTDIQWIYEKPLNFTFQGKATRPDSITLITESQNDGILLAYRDSFGNLLFPYLAATYGNATFSRSTSYDLTKEADYVLVELVERNLSYLLSNVPIMPSPVVSDIPSGKTAGELEASIQPNAKAPQDLCLWNGSVDFEAGSRLYIQSAGIYYEAFHTENGFAVYLPQGQKPESLTIHCNETVVYKIT